MGPPPPLSVALNKLSPPRCPGLSWFLRRLSAPALKWQLAQAWPSLPTLASQKNAFPSAIAAGLSRTKASSPGMDGIGTVLSDTSGGTRSIRPICASTAGIASFPLMLASGVTPTSGTIRSPDDEVMGAPKVMPDGPPTTASAETVRLSGPTAPTSAPGIVGLPGKPSVGSRLNTRLAGRLAPAGGNMSGSSSRASIPGRPGPRAPTGAHTIALISTLATARCHGRTRGGKFCLVMICS